MVDSKNYHTTINHALFTIHLSMKVQIFRKDKTLDLPKYETEGSFGFDMSARETTIIEPQSLGMVPSNLIVKCPKDLALLILPRSSTFRKKSLVFPHSIGLIDRDYCGPDDEIMIQVYNMGKTSITVERGERIAQGLFMKTAVAEFVEVDEDFLGTDSRGGFGSTD